MISKNKEKFNKSYYLYPLGLIIAIFLITKADTLAWGSLILISLNIIYPIMFIISNRVLSKPHNKKVGFYLNTVLYLLALKTNLTLLFVTLGYEEYLLGFNIVSTLLYIYACFTLVVYLIYYNPQKNN